MIPSSAEQPEIRSGERRWVVRYAVLTVALGVPLLLAFIFVRSLYPFAASTMMIAAGDLESGKTAYILRGETFDGELIDLPPTELTNALAQVTWVLVPATVQNRSFAMRSPHPENALLIQAAGGREKIPRAARLNDLLRAWGEIYNSRMPPASPRRLRAVILSEYRWEGGYSDYQRFVESWKVEL